MTEFDPEKFEDKYLHYLDELDHAYRSTFEHMNERYDSDVVHAIDQQILDRSEPLYEGDGTFRVDVPEDAIGRLKGVLAPDDKIESILEVYLERLEADLARVFGFESDR